METSTGMRNLISNLPEIIYKIMEFLPSPDLESVSLVNSTWEKEALRHLLARNPVDVLLHNVTDPPDLIPLRNLSPTQLDVIAYLLEDDENGEILISKIESFTAINFTTVTKLRITFAVDNYLRHVASHFARTYESFKNLRSLEFQIVLGNYKELFSSDQNWADLFPDGHVPQKLTNLTLNLSELYPYMHAPQLAEIFSLTTRILAVFRQVKSLTLIDTPGGLIQENCLILPHLASISLIRTCRVEENLGRYFQFKAPLAPNFSNITRLEFNVPIINRTNECDILNLLAPQLEHVVISAVDNIPPSENLVNWRFTTIPILPRLKIFEILRKQSILYEEKPNWFRPDLRLKFETERDEVKLDYGKQFPVLERLIVHVVREPVPWGRRNCPDDNLHFEATMLFLYETFLAEGVQPCGTLRNLDIPFPKEEWDVGRMQMKWRCEGEDFCTSWGWREEVPDFYDRIYKIFPNLEYHVVEKGKKAVRKARVRKFKEMGVTLGVFNEEGRISTELSEMFGSKKE